MNKYDLMVLKVLEKEYPNAHDKSKALEIIEQQNKNCSENIQSTINKHLKNQFNGHISEIVATFDKIKRDIIKH